MKQDHLPDSAPAVPDAVKDLVAALGAGLSIWGAVNLLEGYETDDPALKDYGLSLAMRGSAIAALGASGFGCPPELLSGDGPDIS
ncbi:MAG: Maff2 family protein [Oscillospiraceae bacterium]